MSEPFLGQITIVGFDFPPRGWARCDGQLLPIAQNQALFALLGTTYGGDGRVTFALPDLRGRVPIHVGNGVSQGQTFGEAAHTLTAGELPAHSHALAASTQTAQADDPAGNYLASSGATNAYAGSGNGAMHASTIASAGGNQPHNNMQPYLTLNFVIAIFGIFPSRS